MCTYLIISYFICTQTGDRKVSGIYLWYWISLCCFSLTLL